MRNTRTLSDRQKKIIYAAALLFAAVLMLTLAYFVGKPLLEHLEEPDEFREWIGSFGVYSKIVFVFLVILQVIVAVIPGEPFEIMSGYAFGFVWGSLLCLIGITIGSMVIFLLIRKLGKGLVEVFFSKKSIERISFLKDQKKLHLLTFIIFAIPGTPKDLLTYTVGLTPMSARSWAVICFLSRIPSVITSAYAGHLLEEQEYLSSVVVFIITAAISLLGVCIYSKYSDKSEKIS